jgi:hypothetical protein
MAAPHSLSRVDVIRSGRYDWHMDLRWERA